MRKILIVLCMCVGLGVPLHAKPGKKGSSSSSSDVEKGRKKVPSLHLGRGTGEPDDEAAHALDELATVRTGSGSSGAQRLADKQQSSTTSSPLAQSSEDEAASDHSSVASADSTHSLCTQHPWGGKKKKRRGRNRGRGSNRFGLCIPGAACFGACAGDGSAPEGDEDLAARLRGQSGSRLRELRDRAQRDGTNIMQECCKTTRWSIAALVALLIFMISPPVPDTVNILPISANLPITVQALNNVSLGVLPNATIPIALSVLDGANITVPVSALNNVASGWSPSVPITGPVAAVSGGLNVPVDVASLAGNVNVAQAALDSTVNAAAATVNGLVNVSSISGIVDIGVVNEILAGNSSLLSNGTDVVCALLPPLCPK